MNIDKFITLDNLRTFKDSMLDVISKTYAQIDHTHPSLESQLQALALGMKVVGSVSPSNIFKGINRNITVTATVQNKPADFVIDEIKIGNTAATINTSTNKGTITETVKLSGSSNTKSWTISANVSGIPFSATATVNARYPIIYGMDTDNNGVPASLTTIDYSKMGITTTSSDSSSSVINITNNSTNDLLKRDKYRTSARDYSYEKITNTTSTPKYFYVLVPSDVSQPTGFSMGGAPFTMNLDPQTNKQFPETTAKTINYTIDGTSVTYTIYKSGGTYSNGGSVTLSLSK